eukprot:1057834-Pelagomonas_calceolata.AAC.2
MRQRKAIHKRGRHLLCRALPTVLPPGRQPCCGGQRGGGDDRHVPPKPPPAPHAARATPRPSPQHPGKLPA